ncbi:hypothetical protein TRIUR3_12029 [Triticum urartu]|uniref:Protein FAR1-RELATED SEQUENCE n=1 Tax=Triticum urartu TaxID=4572 RepID=M7YDA6_TRIUA|nr:hypothetical protein TRIUR3_12029 [Triticum urartu]
MDGLEFFFEEAESGLVSRADAGDLLGGGIDVVESVVASIHEGRGRSSDVISSEPMDDSSAKEQLRVVGANLGSYNNGVSEVVGDSNDVKAQNTSSASIGEEGDAEGVVVNKTKASCWTRRVRIGNAPEERDANPSRVPALEASMRAYAENKGGTVVNPSLGTSFDTVEEAYEFYNLYSWEMGFGVRKQNEAYTVDRALVETLALVFAFFPTDVGLHLNLAAVRAHDERQVLVPLRGTN